MNTTHEACERDTRHSRTRLMGEDRGEGTSAFARTDTRARFVFGGPRSIWSRARVLLKSSCIIAAWVGLSGCSALKPAKATARYYVLAPVAATPRGPASLAVGLGQVKLPPYLMNTSLAVRRGANEVEYLDSAFWAEHLAAGFQRVLAADLAIVLPADQVRLSAWQRDDVAAEAYVTVEQFDVDATGQGVLTARWRILAPGGEKTLKAGESRLTRPGPAPDVSATGAVATLSELVAELSRRLAQAVREATPSQGTPDSR